ncbi:MFS transporter [Demetria terragena]|uniref:MFS transporter n=1 Tax=Demetria terragena TaxID=63959 RepID=UPI00039EE60E|nr:MFS transporter [Demetria terragena]
MGRATAAAGRGTARVARRATEAEGAGETGLSRLIQVHAFSMAGDTAVMVGLAGTLFFQVPQGQAKDQVLMFLLLTMLPFAIVAPLIGPLLDRFRHGRRWSIGATLALRAFLCWVLAGSISEQSSWQFPAALGVLVASKAYLITRSSATPRLLPAQLTLVKANGRLSLAGTVGAAIGGGLAGVAAQFGAEWGLRVGFALFIIGTILAVMLPAAADSAQGEEQAAMRDLAAESEGGTRRGVPGVLVTALRANTGLRWLSGFLTIYLAFLLRAEPFPGWEGRGTLLLTLVVGAAGVGNAIGTMTGALVRTSAPRVIILVSLCADAAIAVVAAVWFNIFTAVAVALVAGIGQQMGKLALDALIQDNVAERIRTSVFARSETLLQLAWVLGGLVGVLLPMSATIGMTTAAVLLALWTIAVMLWSRGHAFPARRHPGSRRRRRPSDQPRPGPVRSSTHDHDGQESTVPIRRDDPWQPSPRRGAPDADDRRDRWRSRFGPEA